MVLGAQPHRHHPRPQHRGHLGHRQSAPPRGHRVRHLHLCGRQEVRSKNFFKNALVPPGVPTAIKPIVAVIELISTFMLRPITLTLRLPMNMIVGHFLLVLFFSATQFFLFTPPGRPGTASSASGPSHSASPSLSSRSDHRRLQAYIFTLLTAVYIQLAVARGTLARSDIRRSQHRKETPLVDENLAALAATLPPSATASPRSAPVSASESSSARRSSPSRASPNCRVASRCSCTSVSPSPRRSLHRLSRPSSFLSTVSQAPQRPKEF